MKSNSAIGGGGIETVERQTLSNTVRSPRTPNSIGSGSGAAPPTIIPEMATQSARGASRDLVMTPFLQAQPYHGPTSSGAIRREPR